MNYSKSIEVFSKLFLDLVGFAYVLRSFPIIQDLLRFHNRFPFLFETIEIEDCLDPPKRLFNFGAPWAFNDLEGLLCF